MSKSPIVTELNYELSEEAKKAFRKLRHDVVNDLSIVIMALSLKREDMSEDQYESLRKRCYSAIEKLDEFHK